MMVGKMLEDYMISIYYSYIHILLTKRSFFKALCKKLLAKMVFACLFSPFFSPVQNPPLSRPKHSYNKAPRCDWWESDSNTSKRAVPQL